jgi:ribonuclease HII
MSIYQHDNSYRKQGFGAIAGIDEAGRGPLAGPVVAAAVVLPEALRINGLRDSKKVPERERETLFWDILSLSVSVGIGLVDHDDIDRINILNATRLAMKIAVEDLHVRPSLLIIDAVSIPSLNIRQISPFKAESLSASVAAASIVAKYTRDKLMLHYHECYPQYNFRKHKGYGTTEHIHMLSVFGPCPIHRRSFKRVVSQ